MRIGDLLVEALNETIREGIDEGINEGIKARWIQYLVHFSQEKYITTAQMRALAQVSAATVERDIVSLKKLKLVRLEGARKSGKYVLDIKGKEIICPRTKNGHNKSD